MQAVPFQSSQPLESLNLNELYLQHFLQTMEEMQSTFDTQDVNAFNRFVFYLLELVADRKRRNEIYADLLKEKNRVLVDTKLDKNQKEFVAGFSVVSGVMKFLNYSFRINSGDPTSTINNLYLSHYFNTMRRMQNTFKDGNLKAYNLYIYYLRSIIIDNRFIQGIDQIVVEKSEYIDKNLSVNPDQKQFMINYTVVGQCMTYLNSALRIIKRDVIINADQNDTLMIQPGSNYIAPKSGRLMAPDNLVIAPFDLIDQIISKMTKKRVLDTTIVAYGDKGTGKSEVCLYLAEKGSDRLAKILGGKPEDYFTIDNVRSVDKKGTLKMFSRHQLIDNPNQFLIIDDASIAANARQYYSEENQRLNSILTVSRIYRHCVFINTIASNLIDSVLRQFANIAIEVLGPDDETEINELKVLLLQSPSIASKKRTQYHKFFQFESEDHTINRITSMRVRRPSDWLVDQYNEIRKKNTDAHVLKEYPQEDLTVIKKTRKQIEGNKRLQEYFDKWGPTIARMRKKNKSINEMTRECGGLHRYWIDLIIGHLKKIEKEIPESTQGTLPPQGGSA